jgi:hypothetical protein
MKFEVRAVSVKDCGFCDKTRWRLVDGYQHFWRTLPAYSKWEFSEMHGVTFQNIAFAKMRYCLRRFCICPQNALCWGPTLTLE